MQSISLTLVLHPLDAKSNGETNQSLKRTKPKNIWEPLNVHPFSLHIHPPQLGLVAIKIGLAA